MSSRKGAELELFLIARLPSGRRKAVSVRISPDRPAAELLGRLARHFGLDPEGLRLYAPGGHVPVGGEVGRLGLRMGDELWLVSDSRPRVAADAATLSQWELVVLGGPQAGRRLRLPDGEHVMGRARDSELHLEDPGLSRAHVRLSVDSDGVTLSPASPRAATYVCGRSLSLAQRIEAGQMFEAGHSLLTIRPVVRRREQLARPARNGRIAFNRPPAATPRPAPAAVSLPEAPTEPPRLRVPLAASVAPLMLGLGAWAATRSPAMLLLALGAPLMALAPAVEDRVVGRGQRRRQARRYRADLADSSSRLAAMRGQEAEALRQQAPDPIDLEDRAVMVLPSLWERRPDRPGFLRLRLGWTDAPSLIRVDVPELGRPDLRAEAIAMAAATASLPNVPLMLELGEVGAAAVTGPPQAVAGLARWLVAQAAVLHSPRELSVAAHLVPDESGDWEWLTWLPHSRDAGRDGASRPRLVLAQDDAGLTKAELGRLMSQSEPQATFVLWLGSSVYQAPEGCRALIEVSESATQVRFRRLDGAAGMGETAGVPDLVKVTYAERVARALSGLEDAAGPALEGVLPGSAGLLECLELSGVTTSTGGLAAAVAQCWSAGWTDLSAPLGIGAAGVVSLDLREHGPHALVGGTSGSGKSELLRAWVTGLAARHSPRQLNVLLIDFKGGTAFHDCARLPHVVGLVTDLSEHLLERVRRSLLAELKRREALLARHGHKEFVDLQRERPDDAPPALLVVFDEFEQLQAERPLLVSDVIVPIARLGRGLGVHMVLGTQRPQGAVPETIRANANIRVALRMLSETQSRDVIDAPDAAHLPPSARGRAYVRLSHQRLVPIQVAFAGARSSMAAQPSVDSFPPCPKPSSSSEGEGRGGVERQPSDFDQLTDAVAAAARQLGIGSPRRPWLPPLPEILTLARSRGGSVGGVSGAAGGGGPMGAQIGLVDEPSRQAQWCFKYSPRVDGHLLAYGGAGSGKSTLLRTLACALARTHSPSDLWLYGLDFSAGALRALAALPHTGGVTSADDPERVAQLLRQLSTEAAYRRRLNNGRDACSDARPMVVLLVDELDCFRSAFDRVDGGRYVELLEALVRDGRAASMFLALTTTARRDLSGPLAVSIGRKVVLRPGRDDQESLGLPPEVRATHWPPGRGVLDGRLEVQIGVLADGSGEAETAAVHDLAGQLADRHSSPTTRPATLVTVAPDEVAVAALPSPSGPMRAVAGLGGDVVAPVEVDLLAHGHLIVSGPRVSGRTTTLVAVAASLGQRSASQRLVLMAAGRRSKLEAEAPWWRMALGVEACNALAVSLTAELAPEGEASLPTAIIIDDAELLLEGSGDSAQRALARLGRDLPVRTVVALEVRALRRYSEWLGELRESRHALLLNPDVTSDGEPFGVGPMPRPLRPWPPGRGYLVRRGQATLVQVAH